MFVEDGPPSLSCKHMCANGVPLGSPEVHEVLAYMHCTTLILNSSMHTKPVKPDLSCTHGWLLKYRKTCNGLHRKHSAATFIIWATSSRPRFWPCQLDQYRSFRLWKTTCAFKLWNTRCTHLLPHHSAHNTTSVEPNSAA